MSIATLRAGIVSKLNTISSVNKVVDYVIWTDDWNVIYDKFSEGNERVNVWMVGLASSALAIVANGFNQRPYTFNIIGYYSIKTSNESSKVFEDIINDILYSFDSTTSIASGSEIVDSAQLINMTNTIWSQHPCHTATIQLPILTRQVSQNGTLCN